jgi:hypothetical protein
VKIFVGKTSPPIAYDEEECKEELQVYNKDLSV